MAAVRDAAAALKRQIATVIVGAGDAVELLFAAVLVEGHVLITDVPGVGKTTLARCLARSLDLRFARLQCTPDLVPSDVTGISLYDPRTQEFSFRAGPVMTNVLLVDEINRATPRVQSALLEAMQERQVTIDERTHPLPRPFFVIATQNPIELEGTFPLPEAQLDRFLMLISLGYPNPTQEDEILVLHGERRIETDSLPRLLDAATLMRLAAEVDAVSVGPAVRSYIVALVGATRALPELELGASPRASLALYRGAQALAAIRGRDFVIPDDVKRLAVPILRHRLFLNADSEMRGRSAEAIVTQLLTSTPVPAEENARAAEA
ncbi:MAG: MoxR family ATPase [Chloroflexi bacterium]|nr:MAG: MoxR family ATPase [Chloroflexota bacterium]